MNDRVEMSGLRFGKWTVISYAGDQRWICRCECGFERPRDGRSLRLFRMNWPLERALSKSALTFTVERRNIDAPEAHRQ